jgi:hypothetical protein
VIRATRVPRPSRPVLLTILVTALLAFPMGIVLASHQFSDVPNSNPFHADIDALVDSGVTAGCGGGKYCPKAAVTREQMAAFLNRLGALAPGKTPVVNATKVDGIDSANLLPSGVLPGGRTIRGTFAIFGTSASQVAFAPISFPVRLPAAPTTHYIPLGGPVPAGCSGTPSVPSASPGHLCVFESQTTSDNNFNCVFNPLTFACGAASVYGFGISQQGTVAGWSVGGTWAATAALGFGADPVAPEGDGRNAAQP